MEYKRRQCYKNDTPMHRTGNLPTAYLPLSTAKDIKKH